MSSKPQQLIVCKNFRLTRKLGTGAFGEIYLAQSRNNPLQKYAAKLEPAITKFPQLYYQAKMYKYLNSFGTSPGIPKVHAMATEGQYNIMLMDLLGSSLEDLFVNAGKKLSLKTVLQIGEQMIERIELMHEKQILHRDIKPDNFLMGIGKNVHLLYVVDLGLSKKYVQDNKHIPYKEGKELTGTARYASINTHMGIEQSRRDDLQSIGYVLLYLLRGILPWQNMKAKDTKTKYKLIMEKKISTPAQFLCKGYPNELTQFINYSKNLKFEEKPDYKYVKGLLETARKNNKIQMDYVYDWTVRSSHSFTETRMKTQDKPDKIEKARQERYDMHIRNKKQDSINEALHNFHLHGGSVPKPDYFRKELSKQVGRSSSKQAQMHQGRVQTTILSSVGLQTLGSTKLAMAKMGVARR